MTDHIYKMTLDLNVLNHLGLNLYSNVAATLSEVVANAWDADAAAVDINIDSVNKTILISDDGCGMSVDEANERFLKVGYDKRAHEGGKTKGGRDAMGRKGIGKLSLFSVADKITVHTSKGGQVHGFILSVAKIKESIKAKMDYHPEPIPSEEIPALAKGTRLKLEQLHKRATSATEKALRMRLARRFAINSSEFSMRIDGEPVSISDREDIKKIQFLWEFEDRPVISTDDAKQLVRRIQLNRDVPVEHKLYKVSGWLGSVAMPRQLDTVDGGNLNSIVVMARGRLIQENILDKINEGGIYTKYLTGQIEADFLDLDEEDDIATSDRQRIIEDDPRYVALLLFVRNSLSKIEKFWTEWRNDIGTAQVQEKYPRLKQWLDDLPDASRRNAKRVIGSIQSLKMDDGEEAERLELLRQGVIAFERLRIRESTDRLASALSTRADELLPLLGEHDQLEAALYLDIVRGRLSVIRNFYNLLDDDEREKVLQKFLFEHLWLLDPSWDRATGSEYMEQQVGKEFDHIDAGLEHEEKAGRVDIKYRTAAQKHVVIELKRASVYPSILTLVAQGAKYREATKKCLTALQRGNEAIEVVFVIGKRGVKEAADERLIEGQLSSINGRLVTFDALIDGALKSYGAFSDARRKLDVIDQLFLPVA